LTCGTGVRHVTVQSTRERFATDNVGSDQERGRSRETSAGTNRRSVILLLRTQPQRQPEVHPPTAPQSASPSLAVFTRASDSRRSTSDSPYRTADVRLGEGADGRSAISVDSDESGKLSYNDTVVCDDEPSSTGTEKNGSSFGPFQRFSAGQPVQNSATQTSPRVGRQHWNRELSVSSNERREVAGMEVRTRSANTNGRGDADRVWRRQRWRVGGRSGDVRRERTGLYANHSFRAKPGFPVLTHPRLEALSRTDSATYGWTISSRKSAASWSTSSSVVSHEHMKRAPPAPMNV
jgi:hypothetical protein